MRFRSLLLACASIGGLHAAGPALTQIRHVYVLPMTGGLDQYLANRLTRNGRYAVVTDPAQADAIFTDQIGSVFEERLRDLYPPPEPEEKSDDKKEDNSKDQDN